MTGFHKWTIALASAAMVQLSGCRALGKVEQGRVIAYDKQAGRATLIREASPADPSSAGVLPPVTIKIPADPGEMGPAPAAGKLMKTDTKARRIVIFDSAGQSFRTIEYTPVEERRNVAKAPASPAIDRKAKTITLYSAAEKTLVTFRATDELLALPADTWKSGDVIRYYCKQPDQALRLMNVTRTDLAKSGG